MSEPVVAKKGPYAVELEPGSYWWCRCGKSARQPFCDGAHKGTEFSPVKVEIAEGRKVFLCGCKHTENQPFCDGSHSRL